METLSDEIKSRISKIQVFITDIDGVLTDGRIVLGHFGDELKFFDVQDGFGLVLLKRAGIKTFMVSGKKSRINDKRGKELEFVKIYQQVDDKLKIFEKILKKYRVHAEQVCYIGDDLIDLPVMARCGFAVAVKNAVHEVKDIAHYVTHHSGGRGAVRETADLILKTKGSWLEVTERYFR